MMQHAMMTGPLFAALEPRQTGRLAVGDGHSLWWAEYGNPDGLPVVVLHGGPGSGSKPSHAQRFDPAVWRIVCFDQRGAGQSLPKGALHANTTPHLVQDVVTLCDHLQTGPVALYGTSWGSTLALAVAQRHPERVRGLVVGGIFWGMTEIEQAWFCAPHGGAALLQPAALAALNEALGWPAPDQLMPAALAAMAGPDAERARQVAMAWALLEGLLASPVPDAAALTAELAAGDVVAFAKVELHYLANGSFLAPGQLQDGLGKIADLPCEIVQGTLDFVTPPAAAWALHQALPKSTLTLVPGAGHMSTPELDAARVAAIGRMAKVLGAA